MIALLVTLGVLFAIQAPWWAFGIVVVGHLISWVPMFLALPFEMLGGGRR